LLRSFGVCVQAFSRCPSSPCFKKLIGSNNSAKHGDLSDELGRTSLSYVILGEHIEVVKYLLQGNAEPNVEDDLGQTSLHLLALSNNPMPELAELLIEAGADINTRDKKGMCALHYAAGLHKPYVALEKRFDLIVILVKKGVTIDCPH
jgi:ankyrin repeat protein